MGSEEVNRPSSKNGASTNKSFPPWTFCHDKATVHSGKKKKLKLFILCYFLWNYLGVNSWNQHGQISSWPDWAVFNSVRRSRWFSKVGLNQARQHNRHQFLLFISRYSKGYKYQSDFISIYWEHDLAIQDTITSVSFHFST